MIDRTRERLIPIGRVGELDQFWPDGEVSLTPRRSRAVGATRLPRRPP